MRRAVLILLLCFTVADAKVARRSGIAGVAPGPGFAWVKTDTNLTPCDSTSGTTISKAITGGSATGDLIVVDYTAGNSVCRPASGPVGNRAIITDSLGNTYQDGTYEMSVDHSQCAGSQWAVSTGTGANTVLITFDNAAGFKGMAVTTYTGAATSGTLRGFATGQADHATHLAAWSTAAVSVQNRDLIHGFMLKASDAATASTPGSGFTERLDDVGGCGLYVEQRVASGVSSSPADGTANGAAHWLAIEHVFVAQ